MACGELVSFRGVWLPASARLSRSGCDSRRVVASYEQEADLVKLLTGAWVRPSLLEMDNAFEIKINENPRDRDVCVGSGWVIEIGYGPDFLQKPDSWVGIGA